MRRCSKGYAAAILAVSLLAAARPMQAATLPTVTEAQLRATIARLQTAAGACAASTAPAAPVCDPSSVGDDLHVGDPAHGGYAVHWGWLREALEQSKAAEPKKRRVLLQDSVAALHHMEGELDRNTSMPPQQQEFQAARFQAAHSDAVSILAEPEFQRNHQLTWWDRQKARFYAWLGQIFAGLALAGAAAPWLGPVLEWSFFVLTAAGLLFFLLRVLARQRLRISLAGEALPATAWDREATDWAKSAEEFAAKSEWRDAVHCMYWAAIVSLESRRAWRHNPTRTPREYVRLLKAGSPQQLGLRSLTRIFERVWYGLRDARAEEYAAARALYEELAAGSVTAGARASGVESAGPLPSGGAV